jgi:hypothetical protein
MRQTAVFWTDPYNLRWIRSELGRGRLRQGWGHEGCQLMTDGLPTSYEIFASSLSAGVQRFWNERLEDKAIRTRFAILNRMLRLEKGDRLVVPGVPDSGIMTLATVRNGYGYDSAHFGKLDFHRGNDSDFIHFVDIDEASLAAVEYSSSIDSRFVASKFSFYRSAITFVRKSEYLGAIERLFEAYVPS